jgi:hypothetical protein
VKWIYLIKAEIEDVEYYKIGITKREPMKRLKELQTGNALQLELIKVFHTNFGNLFESTLHRTYLMEKEKGEWFALTKEQVDGFILTCNKIENNLRYVYENNSFIENKKWKKY